ncbi:Macrolide export ATP-binding/permease protein MacB [Sedimentisphaera cyanobacteriorum]|uniref:Macrolide export ATP-binding/permease protein MacB n=1 Tax=Sedimentisphaera cyanobacteriorum TaxID=1940790 RepID=A0A1Q2HNH1_9BACT|nr:ABC transporter ATP-binding protein [Sedimentisphaera cyanobacteriorum]AQQ09069.1 Macrolide export ATP-binding/permease protein MacB [Sedimentisphaera cyanobacteriorum]
MNSVIELSEIHKSYQISKSRNVPVLKGINFSVDSGEYLGIMGASGSGKSTLLNVLGLLDLPTKGSYSLEGSNTSTLGDRKLAELRNKKIGFIFQSFNLFGYLSVAQNIEVPLVYGNMQKRKRGKISEELAERLGLGHRLKHRPYELSGGERQRVAIARALSNSPTFILADEPTGNLDENTGNEVMDLFRELNENGTTIIAVTHNPEYESFFDRVVYLRDGKVEADYETQ